MGAAETKYCYSHDGELFHGEYDTIEAAIDEAFCYLDDEMIVFIGECVDKKASDYISEYSIHSIFEGMQLQAYEDVGEVAEDWLTFPSPVFVVRNGEMVVSYHAKDWPDEKKEADQREYEAHKFGLRELTEQIKRLIDQWAVDHAHQPDFWGVQNIKKYLRNGEAI